MKKTLTLFVLVLGFFLISCDKSLGCDLSQASNIELLVSSTGVEVSGNIASHPAITSYQEYLLSGYDFDLDESFFTCNVLYQYSFMSSNLGSNMFVLDSYVNEGNTLIINYINNPEPQILLPAFGTYTMVFSIGRGLFDSADTVVIQLQS